MKFKEKLIRLLKRLFCKHEFEISTYDKTLTSGDKIKYIVATCKKCGYKVVEQFYLGDDDEK